MIEDYLEIISLAGRLHRIGFELLQKELLRIGVADLTSTHAFVLMNIADHKNPIDEVRNSTNFVGSSITTIVQVLVKNGYVTRSPYGQRVLEIWLSRKGKILRDQLAERFE